MDQPTALGEPTSAPPVEPTSIPSSPTPFVASAPKDNTKRFSKKLALIIGVVAFLGLAFSGIVYASAYTEAEIPLIGSGLRKQLTLLAYRLPLLPKTPRQILTAVSETNKALTTYTADFSFSAKVGGAALSAGSVDLELKGPIDFSDPKSPRFDISATGNVNFFGTKIDLAGKARGLDKIVYFKIEELPERTVDSLLNQLGGIGFSSYSVGPKFPELTSGQIAENLKPVLANWITYDTAGLDTKARQAMEDGSQNQSIIDTTRRKIQNILLDKSVMPEVKLLGVEKLDGVNTHHLQVSPSKDTVRRVITELVSTKNQGRYEQEAVEQLISAADAVVLDAWFGTSDSLPRKVSAQVSINLGGLLGGLSGGGLSSPSMMMGALGSNNLSLGMVLGLTDIGKNADISVPSPVVSADEYGKMFANATISPEQKAWNDKLEQYRVDFADISKGLLKYFVDNGSYPNSLTSVFGDRYGEYQYRLKTVGSGYVVFVETGTDGAYYGITADYSYPRNLTQRDF